MGLPGSRPSADQYYQSVPRYPSRVVCLTEETTETLYLLGAGDLVVGVSGYTARPPEARHKPKVSAFINAASTRYWRSIRTSCSHSPIFRRILQLS
jgi:ABC-type hemin transport system substrate-binding protein